MQSVYITLGIILYKYMQQIYVEWLFYGIFNLHTNHLDISGTYPITEISTESVVAKHDSDYIHTLTCIDIGGNYNYTWDLKKRQITVFQ